MTAETEKQRRAQVLRIRIRNLKLLTAECRKQLNGNGIKDVGDLVNYTRAELGGYEHDRLDSYARWLLGVRSLDGVESALRSLGLKLSKDPSRK